jgi:hypothetical protein
MCRKSRTDQITERIHHEFVVGFIHGRLKDPTTLALYGHSFLFGVLENTLNTKGWPRDDETVDDLLESRFIIYPRQR